MKIVKKDQAFIAYNDNDVQIGEAITAPTENEGVVAATSAYVDPEYRSEGIAGQLVDALAEDARQQNYLVYPVCPYVVKKFDRETKYRDIDSRH